MISRRNFLTGLVGAAVGTELVVKASVEDVQRFATAKQVNVIKPDVPGWVASGQYQPYPVHVGETLFNAAGRPVGVVSDLMAHREQYDVTSHNDTVDRYVLGSALRVTARLDCLV